MAAIIDARPIEAGENLPGYASFLAHQLFQGIVRDTGLPYTQEHLAEVARLVSTNTLKSDHQEAAVAAAWLHDAAEDITGLDVRNPFRPAEHKPQEGVVYLNDLLAKAGEAGKAACFIAHLMTHRQGVLYQDYVYRIFNFPESGLERALHILAANVKMADRRMNLNPDETRNVNGLAAEYFRIAETSAGRQELETFYKRTKTIDAFRKKGELGLDVGLFVTTLLEGFKSKQRAVAVDNLALYLPLAEKKLLLEVGENNGLFNWEKVRGMLKGMYIDSLRMYSGDLHEVSRFGVNRSAPKVDGYVPLLREIRDEVARGMYSLRQ